MEFSCIGDAVNLASRTEGLTKYYGLTILITENTLVDTGNQFITREVESVIVTGKKTSVKMYELVGRVGDAFNPDMLEAHRIYGRAMELYRRQDFIEAAHLFQNAIDLANDGPSKALLPRTLNYINSPPEGVWTAEYIASGK
jgi:adenylate cyclase